MTYPIRQNEHNLPALDVPTLVDIQHNGERCWVSWVYWWTPCQCAVATIAGTPTVIRCVTCPLHGDPEFRQGL